jgi:signal transduction histidine kinase
VSDPAWAKKEGMVAFAGYLLAVENRLIGVLGLFARHPLGQDALTSLASVSATIAIAIERKRWAEELARRAAELKRSNDDLEQFAHVASHDLRSPTNIVLQFTELMMQRQGSNLDPEMKQFLSIVRDSAKRMDELVSALLSYSRLNDAAAQKPHPVSSLAAYEGAVANLQIAIGEAQAHIERDELPEVLSSQTRLSQVFQNLISNAITYRGDAPPYIRISAERRTSFWMFSVTDNGPGIAARYHSVIFEPFKRLHGVDRPGSGIGLAFCRKFIEREGGTIWVESEGGKGASFRFTLPAIERAPSWMLTDLDHEKSLR